MTDVEHAEIVRAESEGRLVVGVRRAFARDLFLYVPLSEIRERTGESVFVEKAVAWLALLGSLMALLGSCAVAALAFGWWAVAIIPVLPAVWFFYASLSVRGTSRLELIAVIVLVIVALVVFGAVPLLWSGSFAIAFAASLFLLRLLYAATTFLFRLLVMRNRRAWEAFDCGIGVQHTSTAGGPAAHKCD